MRDPRRIHGYRFGRVVADGREHASDLIVLPEGVHAGWRRREGHRLVPEDLAPIEGAGIEVLVIGTGAAGLMRVPPETLAALEARGMKVHAARTGRAVELYAELAGTAPRRRVAAALHLTC